MESVNVASVIAMLHQRIKLWAPNYIDTTEFNRIREAVNEALDANSERNKELDALRVALTEKDREIERLKEELESRPKFFPHGMIESLERQLSASQAREREAVERAEQERDRASRFAEDSRGKARIIAETQARLDYSESALSASQAREREAREEARINLESAKAEAIDRDAMLARAMQAEAREREAVEKLQKMQELLDILTTPNVSYFDMTPAEEIARLESALTAARKALEKIAQAPGDNIGVWCRDIARAALNGDSPDGADNNR